MLRDGGALTGLPEAGDRMEDGTIYAGISPDNGKPMYTTAEDALRTFTFSGAKRFVEGFNLGSAHGHHDWRVPTKGELNVLFQNRAAIGGFDISGSDPAGWYWSSSQGYFDIAWAQRFSDGGQYRFIKDGASSLRCVR